MSVEPTIENQRAAGVVLHRLVRPLSAPERFMLGDKRRFHWREYNGRYEVYSIGLEQWAECDTPQQAETVANALEAFYDA